MRDWAEVHRLVEREGWSKTAVAERLGMSRNTVDRLLASEEPLGYSGGTTILKDRLKELRPLFVAAKSYQRTSYLRGEIAQLDWWHTGVQVPVGKGAAREAFGLVATLPHSAAHSATFTFGRTTPEFCAAVVGCFRRLGGVSEKAVVDDEGCIVKPRRGGPPRLVDEVAALFGQLLLRPVVLRPRFPEGKGQDERTVGYLETSFLGDSFRN